MAMGFSILRWLVPDNPGAIEIAYLNALKNYSNCPPGLLMDYVGDPQRPFPWLTWNNRPYTNAMELMLVPASGPSRFGWEFSYKTQYTDAVVATRFNNGSPTSGGNSLVDSHYSPFRNPPWSWIGPNTAPARHPFRRFRQSRIIPPQSRVLNINAVPQLPKGGSPFGHLLNFFTSNAVPSPNQQAVGASRPLGSQSVAANHSRIFEYVHVPSPFSGTQELLTPQFFNPANNLSPQIIMPIASQGQGTGLMGPGTLNPNGPLVGDFAAPFNYVSKYREPGKVNLNTMFDQDINYPGTVMNPIMWQAITNDSFRFSTIANTHGSVPLPGLGMWDKPDRQPLVIRSAVPTGSGSPRMIPMRRTVIQAATRRRST